MEMAIITGTNGNDQIEENTNASTVLALAGADVVVITGDDNVIDGGPGADDLTAIGDRNRLLGRTGSDTLTAEGEDNRLDGGANEDSLGASGNRSTLVGGLNLGRVEGSATPCGLRDVVTLSISARLRCDCHGSRSHLGDPGMNDDSPSPPVFHDHFFSRHAAVAMALVATLLLSASPAHASHTVFCRADLPVHPGEPMTWRANVSGGSGNFTFSWTGNDGLTGSNEVVTKTYSTVGFRFAEVTVIDTINGDQVTSPECHSHVIPVSFSEPPNVNPVLWVPNDIDPAPLVPQVERVWRAIHAAFFDQYGKTFIMNPLTTIVSPNTENDICGDDCTEIPGGTDTIMGQAQQEAQARVGNVIPYTRAVHVLAWGAGGFAGSFGWDRPLSGIGDWALGSITGVPIPPIPPDLGDGIFGILTYTGQLSDVAHELNHAIGWDDPHDFSLSQPPNDYEKQFSLAGPWLTETPLDTMDPVVSFMAPAPDTVVSDTIMVSAEASDETALDAVVFLVDDQFMAVDETSPFSFRFDTTQVGFGPHQLQAIAYDDDGNSAAATQNVTVFNQVAETSCSETSPGGRFEACFFDGTNAAGPYFGTLVDTPFPVPSSNLGTGINHTNVDEIAFGESDTVSAVWRGILDFPPGNYILRFFTDDGLRVEVNGVEILNKWQDQVAHFSRVVALDGPTPILIEWFENQGGLGLSFRWQPTAQEPPVAMVTDFPESVTVATGRVRAGNAGRLVANDNSYLRVSSAKTGTRAQTTAWIGQFPGVPNELEDLRVTYEGSNTRTCTQGIAIWRWTTRSWVRLAQRRVGRTDIAIMDLAPPHPAAAFVSGTSGPGAVRVRIHCQTNEGPFVARGDFLKLDYQLPSAF
jgi:Ca2+-binding RTX toxin-like protein